MIVVRTYAEDVGQFAGLTSAVDFGDCKKRLRLYFRNIGKVKAMLYAGEKISIPYVVLQRDRRVRDIRVSDERRVNKI
ncbi:hypothetical protein ES705_37692 [subsurface metagenome]